jgi:toxin ParE1/3/4
VARSVLEWSPEAVADLEDIAAFIARDNPVAAEAWIDKQIARAEKAALAPRAGRIVPEVDDRDVREVFLRTYRIIYRVEAKRTVILTILEGHRRFGGAR